MAPPRLPPLAFCAECGGPFYVTQPNKIFCDGGCRQTQWNRRVTGGFKLYEAAMTWRIDRPEGALSDLGSIVDQLAAEERIIRRRREARIKRERGQITPDAELLEDRPERPAPGKSSSENVKLSAAQQRALARSGAFVVDLSEGKRPNDPEAWPDNWDGKQIRALRNAVAILAGTTTEDAEATA